jgi:hypothetical protein
VRLATERFAFEQMQLRSNFVAAPLDKTKNHAQQPRKSAAVLNEIYRRDEFRWGWEGQPIMQIAAKQRWQLRLCLCLMISIVDACTSSGLRLRDQFEDQLHGAAPSATPSPTPPNDYFTWGSQFVTTRVVSSGGSGLNQSVHIAPTPNYFSTKQFRARMLLARSEPLSLNLQNVARGGVTFAMRGSGHVVIGIFSGDQSTRRDPLGGFHISNPGMASIAYLSSNDLRALQGFPFQVAALGTYLGPYTTGQNVELRWSIDQNSRTLSLGAYSAGGALADSVIFDAVAPDGTPNTPISTIWIEIALFDASPSTHVYLDNLLVEEIG